MKKIFFLPFLMLLAFFVITSSCNKKKLNKAPNKALTRLVEGNTRFVNNKSIHPNRSLERRKKIALNQNPFAIIVGCSDSRVAPEIIFDEGLGDLFVVRVAGGVVGQIELESVKYSALNLKSSIIIVLGHENCGAVKATIQNEAQNIEEIARIIEPSIEKARLLEKNNLQESAIKANATNMKNLLEKNPILSKLIQDGKLEVYAGYYNLKSGIVEILKD